MHTILYTAEEIPEAPECHGCAKVTVERRHAPTGSVTRKVWYEPCEDHQPKENND